MMSHLKFSALTVSLALFASAAQAALTDGLVAYYPLDDGSGLVAADAAGTNSGSLAGNFTGSEWTTGKVNGGLQFTRNSNTTPFPGGTDAGWINADGLVTAAPTPVLNDTDSYTFSAWAKYEQRAGGNVNFGHAIWGANTAAGDNGNVMRFGLDNDANGLTARASQDLGGAVVPFDDNEFHLLTLTFGPDGNADIYVDDQLVLSKVDDTGLEREKLWSTANLFHFGMEMEANSATDPFSGVLDELAIWDRELSAAEITDLFNNGDGVSLLAPVNPAPVPEPASIAIWALIGLGMGTITLLRRLRNRR